MRRTRLGWRRGKLVGLLGLLWLAFPGLALAADPNPEATATCTTDDGTTCTIRGHHEVPSGTVLDYGDRHVVLHGELTLAPDPGPRTLSVRTQGDFLIRSGGRIGTENRAHQGRDGGDLTLEVGGSLTLHGRLDLDGHASQGTGGHLTLTTGRDLTIVASGAILADGRTGGTLALTVGGDLTLAGRVKARGHPSHGQGRTITLTVGGSTTLTVPGRLRVDGAAAGSITLTVQQALTLDGDLSANGKQGGSITLRADGPVTLGPQATLTLEGEGRAGRGGSLTANFCGASASLAGRLKAEGEGGADGGTLDIKSRGPLTLTGRLTAEGDGRGARGGTITVGATAGMTFGSHARLTAEGHPDGTITLAAQDPLDARPARFEPPFTRVPLGAICGISPLQVPRANHTATLLANGTVLLAGGRNATGPVDSLERFDPPTGSFSALGARLSTLREGHTATVLPDGTILFLGGSDGIRTLDTADLFDPVSGSIAALGSRLSALRSGHTATLLPDGTVLLLGGTSDGTTALASGELFDPASQTFRPANVSLRRARREHTATLLGDATLLVTGGFGSSPLPTAERLSLGLVDQSAPTVVAVRPPDQATDVPSDSRVAIRFSEPINPSTLAANSFRLIDPSTTGPVDGAVTSAEDGLLAFLTPTARLTAGRIYTVQLTAEIKDTSGNALVPFTSTFTIQGANLPLVLLPNPLSLLEGQTASLTIQLPSAAPAGGLTVTLESAAPGIASVPASVPVLAGATSATAPVTGIAKGTTNLTATAPGFAPGQSVVTVRAPVPTLTGFTPSSGKVGTNVGLSGTGFRLRPGATTVTFTGSTTRIPAPVNAATATTLTVTVPEGALTGPLQVTTSGGTATSSGHFVVLPTLGFSLTVEPATVTAIAGTSVSLKMSTVTTGGYTGLTQLSTGSLPVGLTAAFAPPFLGPNASGILTLR